MKKKIVFFCLSIITLLWIIPTEGYSQKRGGGPPPWAPAHGYRAKTRHIYFPDHNFYYDLEKGLYIHLSNGKWVFTAKLPDIFGRYDLNTASRIELDFLNDNPHQHNAEHLVKYKVKHRSSGKKGNPKDKNNGKGKGQKKGR